MVLLNNRFDRWRPTTSGLSLLSLLTNSLPNCAFSFGLFSIMPSNAILHCTKSLSWKNLSFKIRVNVGRSAGPWPSSTCFCNRAANCSTAAAPPLPPLPPLLPPFSDNTPTSFAKAYESRAWICLGPIGLPSSGVHDAFARYSLVASKYALVTLMVGSECSNPPSFQSLDSSHTKIFSKQTSLWA